MYDAFWCIIKPACKIGRWVLYGKLVSLAFHRRTYSIFPGHLATSYLCPNLSENVDVPVWHHKYGEVNDRCRNSTVTDDFERKKPTSTNLRLCKIGIFCKTQKMLNVVKVKKWCMGYIWILFWEGWKCTDPFSQFYCQENCDEWSQITESKKKREKKVHLKFLGPWNKKICHNC